MLRNAPARTCVMTAPQKNRTSPLAAAIPSGLARSPASSPTAPATFTAPSACGHESGTPASRMNLSTNGAGAAAAAPIPAVAAAVTIVRAISTGPGAATMWVRRSQCTSRTIPPTVLFLPPGAAARPQAAALGRHLGACVIPQPSATSTRTPLASLGQPRASSATEAHEPASKFEDGTSDRIRYQRINDRRPKDAIGRRPSSASACLPAVRHRRTTSSPAHPTTSRRHQRSTRT